MLRPQPHPRCPCKLGVAGHHVHLGVVEERVLVEVRGAERQPTIVDDCDLRVDVDRAGAELAERAQRAGENSPCTVVCFDQIRQVAARVVAPVVRIRGQHYQKPEVVGGRLHDFVQKDLHDLARPEKLVLEVDEALRGTKSAHVRLEDPEIAAPNHS